MTSTLPSPINPSTRWNHVLPLLSTSLKLLSLRSLNDLLIAKGNGLLGAPSYLTSPSIWPGRPFPVSWKCLFPDPSPQFSLLPPFLHTRSQCSLLAPFSPPFASALVCSGALSLPGFFSREPDNSLAFGDHPSLAVSQKDISSLVLLLNFRPKYLEVSRNFHLDQHANIELKIFSSQICSSWKLSLFLRWAPYQFSHTTKCWEAILSLSLSLSPRIRWATRFCVHASFFVSPNPIHLFPSILLFTCLMRMI